MRAHVCVWREISDTTHLGRLWKQLADSPLLTRSDAPHSAHKRGRHTQPLDKADPVQYLKQSDTFKHLSKMLNQTTNVSRMRSKAEGRAPPENVSYTS